MLCCRWASPESLQLYKRIGASESISWVDRAEAVPPSQLDSLQLTNLPPIDESDALAMIAREFDDTANSDGSVAAAASTAAPPKRKSRATADGPPTEAQRFTSPPAGPSRPHARPPSQPIEPPSDTSPLSYATSVGRLVMVPATHWPSYTCNELEGRGWRAVVRELKRWRPRRGEALVEAARVHFTRATTTHGVAYSDEWVDLSTLTPL